MRVQPKQIVMLALTVLAFIFLGYQVFEMINSDMSVQTAPAASTASVTTVPPATLHKVAYTDRPSEPVLQKTSAAPEAKPTSLALSTQPSLPTKQKAYVELVNQYEMAKLKNQLLKEQESIANAQVRIATLHQKSKVIRTGLGSLGFVGNTKVQSGDMSYTLGYVGQHKGKWTATLVSNGHYQGVKVGTPLKDGFRVTQIDHHGVTLLKNGFKKVITFNGEIAWTAPEHKRTEHKPQQANKQQLQHNTTQADATQPISARAEVRVGKPQPLKKKPSSALTQADRSIIPAAKMASLVLKPKTTPSKKSMAQALPAPSTSTKPLDVAKKTVDVNHAIQALQTLGLSPAHSPKKNSAERARQHITSAAPLHYTIQLISTTKPAVVQQFLDATQLGSGAMQFSVTQNGEVWHKVVYGDFADLSAAEAALKTLPAAVQYNHPWIRRYSSLQKVLAESVRGK